MKTYFPFANFSCSKEIFFFSKIIIIIIIIIIMHSFKNSSFQKLDFSLKKKKKPFPNFPFKNKIELTFQNLCMNCNLKLFLGIALLRICAYGSISIELIGTHQAYIAPFFALALTYFCCHLFCMVKMRKLWITTRCYPSNSLSLFFALYLYVVV